MGFKNRMRDEKKKGQDGKVPRRGLGLARARPNMKKTQERMLSLG